MIAIAPLQKQAGDRQTGRQVGRQAKRQTHRNGETEAKRKHTKTKTWSHNFRICALRRPSQPNVDLATNIMRTAGLFRCGIGCPVVMVVALAVVAAKPLWL